MTILNGIEVINIGIDRLAHFQEIFSLSSGQFAFDGTVLAQTIRDPNVIGQMQKAFKNFIESGQVWALIIGFVFGYGFKSLLPG
jgi:hypothetical protein